MATTELISVKQTGQDVVGQSLSRIDTRLKVTGKANYTRDLKLPRMLFGRIKRSPFPHARILKIDASKAKSMEGVKAVITGEDFPPATSEDSPPLAVNEVLYHNQAVVAVAATNPMIAEEAINNIEVEYEELPFVTDPEIAMSEQNVRSIIKHPGESTEGHNIGKHLRLRRGMEIDKAFSISDHVIEGTYTTVMETHFQMEPLTFLCQADPDGGLTIWCTNSGAHRAQYDLARYLGIDPHLIRAKVPFLGGWFGSKDESHIAAICAMLALKSKRGVKLELSREETMTASGVRHPTKIYIKDGVTKDGKIIARKIRAIYNGGAYGSQANGNVKAALMASVSVYNIPNAHYDIIRVYTNLVTGAMKRAPMSYQMNWAIESQTEKVAVELKIDPVKFRLMNLLHNGEKNLIGETIDSVTNEQCLTEVVGAFERGTGNQHSTSAWRTGRGIAIGAKMGYGGAFQASVRLRENGRVEVLTELVENGGGILSGVAQIVAQEFSIPLSDVTMMPLIFGNDTATTGFTQGASGSRQLVDVGEAVLMACADVKGKVAKVASARFGFEIADVDVRQGRVVSKTNRGKSIPLSQLFEKAPIRGYRTVAYFVEDTEFVGYGTLFKQFGELDPNTGQATTERAVAYYQSVAQAVELSVNVETGRMKVHRIVAGMDAGRAINPAIVREQITGSVIMGLSACLGEELIISDGRITNANLADYKVITSLDAPSIEPIIVELPHRDGPFGAKGVGEASILPTAPAVRSAVYNAIGVWIDNLPITPENIVDALERKEREAEKLN